GVKPYLSLSGTSMAAPVVTGTVALMLQANPTLTPNLVKALLQYTAQAYPGYSPLRQGAGFLNTLGAVRLAKYYANPHVGDRMPVQKVWSRQINWGSHRLTGFIRPSANAWATNIVWGTSADTDVTWGEAADDVVVYTDDATEPLPNVAVEFGEVTTTTVTDPVTGITTTTVTNLITGETTTTTVPQGGI